MTDQATSTQTDVRSWRDRRYVTLEDEIYSRCIQHGDYPAGWNRHTSCPSCGCSCTDEGFWKWQIRYTVCRDCKLVFADPYPPAELLDSLYNGAYYSAIRENIEIPKARQGRDDASCSMASEFYDEILRYITTRISGGSWLDVGGGIGTFLHRVKRENPAFDCCLNEWNLQSARFAEEFYGLTVLQTTAEEIFQRGRRFDVVTSLAVVEHCTHPRDFVGQLVRLLKPGGLLFLNVPNFTRLSRILSKGASPLACAPYHLSLFNKRNFADMVSSLEDVALQDCWDTGPRAFYATHLAQLDLMHGIKIPYEPRETPQCVQRMPISKSRKIWKRVLTKVDHLTKWPVLQFDGGAYINLAARKTAA